MKKGTVKIRGIRSPIPTGHLVGRTDTGGGDPHPIKAGRALALNKRKLDVTLSGDVTITQTGDATVIGLQGVPVDSATPSTNDVLTFDGSKWAPAAGGGGGGGITELTGDVTAGPGSGSQAATLATVNADVGTFGDATNVAQITVNAKGLITAVTDVPISGGGGSADFVRIATLTPTGNVASFTSIPGTYRNLMIIGQGRSDTTDAQTDAVMLRFNNDSAAHYDWSTVSGFASTPFSTLLNGTTELRISDAPSATGIAGYSSSFEIKVPGYALTANKKGAIWHTQVFGGNTLGDLGITSGAGVWSSAVAITRIDILLGSGGNWAAAEITLYGLT